MSLSSHMIRFLLAHTPAFVKRVMRRYTPQWGYQAVARASAGQSVLPHEPGQLFLSDKRVIRLEERLWHGFAHHAYPELEALLSTPESHQQQAEAAMALARYDIAHDNSASCLKHLEQACASRPLARHKRASLMRAHALSAQGQWKAARHVLDTTHQAQGSSVADIRICQASMAIVEQTPNTVAFWLSAINDTLQQAGHVGLIRNDRQAPLSIANLTTATPPPAADDKAAKVSVLMAVHNRAGSLGYAIESVLAQSWQNLELIIVDDASTDASWQTIRQWAKRDARIVAIRQPTNGGAYVARNRALHAASGDFITVNDADDWSHPQKLETQIRHLLAADAVVANTSSWIRIHPDMTVQPRFDDPRVPVIHKNFSSLMLRRQTALALNGWDTVRMSGDAEFIDRLRAVHGDQAMVECQPGVPLALSLLEKDNLTSSSGSGLRTFFFGARHDYIRQYREWHHSGTDLTMDRTSPTEPFPVPGICLHNAGPETTYSLILVSDFRSMDMLKACHSHTPNMAILPWADYTGDHDLDPADDVTRFCRENGIITLVHGESVRCDRILADTPRALATPPDLLPDITAERLLVLEPGNIEAAQRRHIDATLEEIFDMTPRWVKTPMFAQACPTL